MPSDDLELLQGTLDVLVLRALSWKPMHGYAIVRFIRQASHESLRVQDGALYTSLHRLEARRFVDSEWGISDRGKRAKFYSITTAGRSTLRSEAANWERYVAAVRGVMQAKPETA
jgi:PadR family transcriptional regulator PadR